MNNKTMPRQIWMHEVLSGAGVTVEAAEPFRDKLNRWYTAGEGVDMAAHDLRWLVAEHARQERIAHAEAADGLASIRKALRA